MSDLEMTRLCAKAMGYRSDKDGGYSRLAQGAGMDEPQWFEFIYNPLHDDAQTMALVKKLHLDLTMVEKVDGRDAGWWRVDAPQPHNITCRHADLNRAIVKCVAKMQSA